MQLKLITQGTLSTHRLTFAKISLSCVWVYIISLPISFEPSTMPPTDPNTQPSSEPSTTNQLQLCHNIHLQIYDIFAEEFDHTTTLIQSWIIWFKQFKLPLSAQQATSTQREHTAIITTVHSLIMINHQVKIDKCMAAINDQGTKSIIQNTTQARAHNSNAWQDANDNDDNDNNM